MFEVHSNPFSLFKPGAKTPSHAPCQADRDQRDSGPTLQPAIAGMAKKGCSYKDVRKTIENSFELGDV